MLADADKNIIFAAAAAFKNAVENSRDEMLRDEAERILRIADASADAAGTIAKQEDLDCLVDQVANVIFRVDGAVRCKLWGAVDGQDALPAKKFEQVRQDQLDCVAAAIEKLGGELKFVWEVSGKGKDRKLRQCLNGKGDAVRSR
ncbi:MAG: hypothetical protein IKZ87_01410 [Actinomycetaceae bacterium]|nr:hypothetical protein [Actinomycetaceae bacterium]